MAVDGFLVVDSWFCSFLSISILFGVLTYPLHVHIALLHINNYPGSVVLRTDSKTTFHCYM